MEPPEIFDYYDRQYYSTPEPKYDQQCLHDNCTQCGGTGIRKDGLGSCVHMISCPCPKCSLR